MNSVIVGSGISGLLAGLVLSRRGKKVIIVEKESEIGGLLRAFDYGKNGIFDYGMHNFLETGISEIDDSILNLFPIQKWNMLEGKKRDLAGLFFKGKIQFNSPYIDVTNLEPYKLKLLRNHFESSKNKILKDPKNAEEYGIDRFGIEMYEKTIKIALEKIFKKSPKNLDLASINLTPLSRLVIADENQTLKDYDSEYLKDRIAYPEQRNLPLKFSSGRKGYYPKDFGIYRVVMAIEKEIISNGGQIYKKSFVSDIEIANRSIEKLTINIRGKNTEIKNINSLIWTANILSLGNILKLPFKNLKYDRPLDTYVVNILIDKKPNLKDLYYFFCYDKEFKTFRLTNFSSYCKKAVRNGHFPISLELLIDPSEGNFKLEKIEEIAIFELKKFKVLHNNTNIKFVKAEKLSSGIPMLTKNNTSSIEKIRNKIYQKKIQNLILAGILSEKNLFFQTDVLKDVYRKIIKNEK